MINAVKNNLDLDLVEMKSYLHEDDDTNDTLICMLIEAGKDEADNFCNNPFETAFVDGDGDTEYINKTSIPATVKLGVMEYVAFIYMHRGEPCLLSSSTKSQAISKAKEIWKNYRLVPGL